MTAELSSLFPRFPAILFPQIFVLDLYECLYSILYSLKDAETFLLFRYGFDFFRLPVEEKMVIPMSLGGKAIRGYFPVPFPRLFSSQILR